MAKFATTGLGTARVGYAVVNSTSGPLPAGSGVFSINGGTGLASQVGVPNSPETTSARLYVEVSSSYLNRNTGIALVNRSNAAIVVTLNLAGIDGSVRTATLPIGPNGHIARFVTELFQGLAAEFQGVLTLSSASPISPLTLRLTPNQRGESILSSLPVADLRNPPTGSLFICQIADGGGYRTQFIVIGTSAIDGTIHLDFLSESGASLELPVR